MQDSSFSVGGRFQAYAFDDLGNLLWTEKFRNGVTDEGLLSILDVYFRNQAQQAAWYVAPITVTTTVSASDTLASHSGWTESTAYTESTRPAWSPPAASANILKNTTSVAFTFNASTLVDGLMLASDDTKGDVTGTLWCTGLFSTQRSLSSGQELRIFYELQASAV
jgi:hypothetical protein